MNVTAIVPARGPDGRHRFAVAFEDQGRAFSADLSASDLVSYELFQRSVLDQTAMLYLFRAAEGRPAELADLMHREAIDFHLARAAGRAVAAAAGSN